MHFLSHCLKLNQTKFIFNKFIYLHLFILNLIYPLESSNWSDLTPVRKKAHVNLWFHLWVKENETNTGRQSGNFKLVLDMIKKCVLNNHSSTFLLKVTVNPAAGGNKANMLRMWKCFAQGELVHLKTMWSYFIACWLFSLIISCRYETLSTQTWVLDLICKMWIILDLYQNLQ